MTGEYFLGITFGMEVKVLKSPPELEAGYAVLKELRTNLTFTDFITLYKSAHQTDGYTLIGMVENDRYVAVMGYRILHDFVHGKHLYVDDLVVIRGQQSKGIGSKLLAYAEEIAEKQGCQGLRLCTGKENERGIKFYEREGWNPRAIAFKKVFPLRVEK